MSIISIDFYGNLNQDPDFWQKFMGYAVEEGHKIYIIAGPWPKELLEKVEFGGYRRNTHYHAVHSVLEHLSRSGFGCFLDEDHDTWYSDEVEWWRAKAQICKELNVSIHLDSDNRFAPAFKQVPTRFVHTESDTGKSMLRDWYNQLQWRNEYEDEYAYMGMGGFVPM